jgi:hypothetical protein
MILHGPTLVIDSLGGFFPSICSRFVFFGFVQYLSKIPSLSHFFLERSKDTNKTALSIINHQYMEGALVMCHYLSAIVW